MKTALVFSGGGARGAYQVGVWKALEELNIKCDIVTGVSIGSINAALYVQGDLNKALELWKKLDFNMVFPTQKLPRTNKETLKIYINSLRDGGLEPTNLEKNLKDYLDIDKIYNSNIDLGIITVKYPKFKEVSLTKDKIEKDKLVDYLIASSTVYPVFQLKEIDTEKYVDGGFITSVPIDLAKKMKADKLIIVNISVKDKNKKILSDENTIVIKPNNKVGAPLFFDSKTAINNINYGYNDTMKAFHKLDGKKYTFEDLKINYKKSILYNTYDKYLNTCEYLGKLFEIDTTKIYTINDYNELLLEYVSNYKKLRRIRNKKERTINIYRRLVNDKNINRHKKVFKREFMAAYYLYLLKNND